MPSIGRGHVHLGNREEHTERITKFRRWRPWMWGPLRHCWMFTFDDVTIHLAYGPTAYEWCGWRKKGWVKMWRTEDWTQIQMEEETDE